MFLRTLQVDGERRVDHQRVTWLLLLGEWSTLGATLGITGSNYWNYCRLQLLCPSSCHSRSIMFNILCHSKSIRFTKLQVIISALPLLSSSFETLQTIYVVQPIHCNVRRVGKNNIDMESLYKCIYHTAQDFGQQVGKRLL